uniref:Isopentenyl-diphosphate delta-isomerase, putative n=1 Tax=Entamoeba histolytica TaxID=5759 RepID=A0A060N1V5_ENTHI|nr:isopentenyl-diphosphate delta-isomerase, putative [Entamoeba histolytica]
MSLTPSRKLDHLKFCCNNETQSHQSNHLEDIILEKTCFPKQSLSSIQTKINFFNKELSIPLIIGAMTGGSNDVKIVNKTLAIAANETNVAIGVGSQRSGLESNDEEILESYRVVRECAPNAFIIGNIGSVQLTEYGEVLDDLIAMIKGDAIAVHLNWEQELVQAEGDRNGIDVCRLKEIISKWNGTVIGKQVGHGMMKKDVMICQELGMKAVDIAGIGGTSFAGVECLRAKEKKQYQQNRLGQLLWDFGVPTAMSIWEAPQCSLPIIASGGIRNGLEIVKSMTLGASLASITKPFVSLYLEGSEACINYVNFIKNEIQSSLFLCGCPSVNEVHSIPKIITGELYHWMKQRNKMITNNI